MKSGSYQNGRPRIGEPKKSAGRPKNHEHINYVRTTISIPQDLYDSYEELRGKIKRSTFYVDVLQTIPSHLIHPLRKLALSQDKTVAQIVSEILSKNLVVEVKL